MKTSHLAKRIWKDGFCTVKITRNRYGLVVDSIHLVIAAEYSGEERIRLSFATSAWMTVSEIYLFDEDCGCEFV